MIIRPVKHEDFFSWHRLYAGYGEFYGIPLTDEKAVKVWGWLERGEHSLHALVAEDDEGNLCGLAHVRWFARPLAGGLGLYLDDLFVDPEARRSGIGRALIEAASSMAREAGAGTLRWVTAPDNVTARRLYDEIAQATSWVTYDRETVVA